jgi:hypothetical protein
VAVQVKGIKKVAIKLKKRKKKESKERKLKEILT